MNKNHKHALSQSINHLKYFACEFSIEQFTKILYSR